MAAAVMAVMRLAGTVYIQRSTSLMRCSMSRFRRSWVMISVSSFSSIPSSLSFRTASVTAVSVSLIVLARLFRLRCLWLGC